MSNKRNTKLALASLLATSAIVPAIAVSAEEGNTVTPISETTTPAASDVVNFTVDNAALAKYLPTSGKLFTRNGQNYISLDLEKTTLDMIKELTINGEPIITVVPGVGTFVAVPVNADFDPVPGSVTLTTPIGEMTEDFTFTPEKPATDGGTKPTTPTAPAEPAVKAAPLKYLAYDNVPDGEYDVTFDAYNFKTGAANYTAITNQLDKAAKLVVKDGKYFLDISEAQRFKEDGSIDSWIVEYQVLVNGEYVKAESVQGDLGEYPHVVRIPLESLNDLTTAKLNVVVPKMNMDHWYDFKIAVNKGQDLPQLVPTYVYKDGTSELSIMQNTYLSSTTKVEKNENGKYDIDVTFPQGQYIQKLVFEGQTVAVSDSYEDGKNTVKIFTVEVADPTKIYTATFDLDVPNVYTTSHDAQIQFGGKQNGFSDITSSFAYSNIVNLYSKGIFTAANKFNPKDSLQRGHFALMMAKAFELDVPETTPFTDINKQNEAIQNAIKALNGYGIINGTTATTFNPTGSIKRYEAALMIDKMLEKQGIVPAANVKASFTDVANLNDRSKAAIAHLSSLDIIKGKGNNKFDPGATLSRQEMALILDKTLKLIENK